jgi:hypothetical protein
MIVKDTCKFYLLIKANHLDSISKCTLKISVICILLYNKIASIIYNCDRNICSPNLLKSVDYFHIKNRDTVMYRIKQRSFILLMRIAK